MVIDVSKIKSPTLRKFNAVETAKVVAAQSRIAAGKGSKKDKENVSYFISRGGVFPSNTKIVDASQPMHWENDKLVPDNPIPVTQPSAVTPPPVTPPAVTPGKTPIPTYEDFLKGAGQSYANAYSPETINAQYDPYFNFQLGAEDYAKGLAQQQLGTDLTRTTQNVGQNFNDRGLYGSSLYTNQLNQSLGDLQQGFNQQYGGDQYTPYNVRRQNILQNQIVSKDQAVLDRQATAVNAYQKQYYPVAYASQ